MKNNYIQIVLREYNIKKIEKNVYSMKILAYDSMLKKV